MGDVYPVRHESEFPLELLVYEGLGGGGIGAPWSDVDRKDGISLELFPVEGRLFILDKAEEDDQRPNLGRVKVLDEILLRGPKGIRTCDCGDILVRDKGKANRTLGTLVGVRGLLLD